MPTGALIDRRQLGASIRHEFEGRIKALPREAKEAGDPCDYKLSGATVYFGNLWNRSGAYRVEASLDEAVDTCDDADLRKRIKWLAEALDDARHGPKRGNWSFAVFTAPPNTHGRERNNLLS